MIVYAFMRIKYVTSTNSAFLCQINVGRYTVLDLGVLDKERQALKTCPFILAYRTGLIKVKAKLLCCVKREATARP